MIFIESTKFCSALTSANDIISPPVAALFSFFAELLEKKNVQVNANWQ